MSKNKKFLDYNSLIRDNLLNVVKHALGKTSDYGLTDGHHFYITFLTEYPGVEIPDYLKERYPGEMTIVLQYQFYDLDVDDEMMQVKLSFNNIPELLKIPLAAISIFADPSVNFALQFQPVTDDLNESLLDALDEIEGDDDPDGSGGGSSKKKKKSSKKKKDSDDSDGGQVISLDQFRKK